MNHSFSIKSYLNDEVNNKVEDDNPHSIILNILIELKNNISTLAYCLEHDSTVSEVKSKVFKIINCNLYFTIKSRYEVRWRNCRKNFIISMNIAEQQSLKHLEIRIFYQFNLLSQF